MDGFSDLSIEMLKIRGGCRSWLMMCRHRGRDPRQRLLPAREGHREVLRASPAAQHGRPGQEEGHAHQGRHVTNVGRCL